MSAAWNQPLWGVHLISDREKPLLLGRAWAPGINSAPRYTGEPTRALLFETRAQARQWCADRMRPWRLRSDSMRDWKLRPVRVVESVTISKEGKKP